MVELVAKVDSNGDTVIDLNKLDAMLISRFGQTYIIKRITNNYYMLYINYRTTKSFHARIYRYISNRCHHF